MVYLLFSFSRRGLVVELFVFLVFFPMAPNNALKKSKLGEKKGEENTQQRERDGMVTSAEVFARGDGVNKNKKESNNIIWGEVTKLLVCIMFLTRLPLPRWVDHSPKDLVPGMVWFPVVGSLVGLFTSVGYDALRTIFPPAVAASGSTLMGVWLTGCFHEDGLADTMDAFGGGWGRAQILRIMKDSRCGTYAVVGVCLFLITKCSLLVSLDDSEQTTTGVTPAMALVIAHTISRLSALWMCKLFPYVFDDGDDKGLLYNSFAGCLKIGLLTWARVILGSLYTFGLVYAVVGLDLTLVSIVLFGVFVVLTGRYSVNVIGGVIGDYLGCCICFLELLVYMLLTAHYPIDFFHPSIWMPWCKLLLVVGVPAMIMRGAGDLPKYTDDC